jgi:DtxR family Mn-dependent transcriptional regulator
MFSQTEENYLKCIYLQLEKNAKSLVSTNVISEQMKTTAASVTDMLKRLSGKKLIHYKKYQGVLLTKSGRIKALSIVRKHRLWEYFLVEKLKFQWDEIHAVAEQLEHVASDLLIDKLDVFLGRPKFDPHGDPIPDHHGKLSIHRLKNLSLLNPTEKGKVAAVVEQDPDFLKHLERLKIQIETPIKVLDKAEFDRSMTISINGSGTVNISHDIAKNILIGK